ncbi:3'-5' exonuclease [Granulosicoccaceae sp. 1_MG-2023]|nr:3'-5' exonuclease [Granulosicoccaceae sp. 1_MG-2023]
MTGGEKRFAKRLESHLEDDYLCWYEPRVGVGKRTRYADFIVIHPRRGVLLLEVKDWRADAILQIDRMTVQLLVGDKVKRCANPLEQARQCAHSMVAQFEKDPQLVHQDGAYRGKLMFPYGYGVVLSNITRRRFDSSGMAEVLPGHRVICKDEMPESVDPEAFQKRLWDMFEYTFRTPLSLPQLDRIRWHLFPEIRIGTQRELFSASEDSSASAENTDGDGTLPDILRVMDLQQEQLARSLGDGHRVIHGVAGSGKTLILGYRCVHLANLLNKPILVLCYNVTLAARLRSLMQEKNVEHRVAVRNFHEWCGEQMRTYNVPRPKYDPDKYFEALVTAVIGGCESGLIPTGQYGAVMIDEGHDFEPQWLQLITRMVDPETDSLLLLYDDAQSIYKKTGLDFSLASVGIKARGRTSVLRLNYRNTDEVFNFAYRFVRRFLEPHDADEDHVPLVEPQLAGRHSFEPQVRLFDSFDKETDTIARWLGLWHRRGDARWGDMLLLYRHNWQGKKLAQALDRAGVPHHWIHDAAGKRRFDQSHDSVKIMTLHSSKGLEFPLVVIAGLGKDLSADDEQAAREAKLLYVGMTRSTDRLLLTGHSATGLFKSLDECA